MKTTAMVRFGLFSGVVLALSLATPADAQLSDAEIAEFMQRGDTRLPDLEVTGQKIPEPAYGVDRSRSATRTDTPLHEVPQSVSIVTDDFIQDLSIQNIGEALRYVPGAAIAQGEGNRETPILRGNSSTSDFFVDGIRDDVQYFRDLYNLERLEVLRGPNAMIFGRGGIGGVINRVTRTANWRAVREATLEGGLDDHYRATFDVGQGFGDALAGRVTGMVQDSGSFRDGVFLKRRGINPTLGLGLGESTTAQIGYEYFRDERIADRGLPSFNGRIFEADDAVFFGDPNRSPTDTEVHALSAVFDHDFGDNLTLRNSTRYAAHDKFYQNVYAGGPVVFDAVDGRLEVPLQAYNNLMLRDNLFNQTDLVWKLRAGGLQHTLLGGIELGRQDTTNRRNNGTFDSTGTTTFNAPAAAPTIDEAITFAPTGNHNEGDTTIVAVYVQDQVEFSSQWQAVLGVRYDHFKVDFNATVPANGRIETQDDLVSPRAGLVFKPVAPLALYASYSISYLPRAGEQLSSLSPTNRAFDPEEFTNYEVGAKLELARDFELSAAVYELERSNVVAPDPNNVGQSILVDGQRTRGIELGVSGHLTDAWTLAGGYAYQDGEVLEALSAAPPGATLAQTPLHTVSLWSRYDLTPSIGAGLGAYYRSDMFAEINNAVVLDEYVRLDGALYYRITPQLRAQINVENLLDERYVLNAHNNNNISPGAPLTARLGLIANF